MNNYYTIVNYCQYAITNAYIDATYVSANYFS